MNLNLELVNLSRWLNLNKLILNVKKTECMVFGTRQRLASQNSDTIDLNIHGQPIKSTNAFKYLGVVLDSTLSFNDHIEHLRKKLSKVLGVFSRARPPEAANRVYAAMVLPILDYCDIVWHESGQGNDKVVERLQRRAAVSLFLYRGGAVY